MKTKILFLSLALTGCCLSSCDDLLDRSPKDSLTEESVFSSYESVKLYAWQFYDAFHVYQEKGYDGHDNVGGSRSTIMIRQGLNNVRMWSDVNSDMMDRGSIGVKSAWCAETYDVPTSDYDYNAPYQNIRAINFMMEALLNMSALTDVERDHWMSVGYFFRAFNHASLLIRYGGVPYVDKLLSDTSPELYAPRNSRDEEASAILEELLWAKEHIGTFDDGENTINRDVICAFISRFGLMEGTWRKYHGLGDEQKYLQASADAAAELLPKYKLHDNYDEVFNSESLTGVDGIILYKAYVETLVVHRTTQHTRNDDAGEDLTKKAMDMYLCTDGQTRWTSPLYEGDKNIYAEFRNRDKRLYYTVTPPYKVKYNAANPNSWLSTGNPADEEYIELMKELSDDQHKTLPSDQWTGKKTIQQPNLFLNKVQNWNHSGTGYRCWKYYNRLLVGINNKDISDGPIFRIGEVMVNYAEAMYELGLFDQAVCDATINKLRARGGVAPMTVGNEPEDPTRDADVPATLWEIRRERAIELMAEGFRFDDIRRWKKGNYLREQKLGMWIKKSDYPNMPIQNGASEGYIALDDEQPAFQDYYYLLPLPTNQLLLNENLTQNPKWDEE